MERNKNRGITLIALAITIIILLILASVTILTLTEENGILTKSKTTKEKSNKETATESMNLKITNIQISTYVEKQRMPTLQEVADNFYEDNEIEYLLLKNKNTASKEKITIGENKSFFTKLTKYPYEFEIDEKLKLASIDGVKLADESNSKEVEELKTEIEELRTSMNSMQTTMQTTITSLQTRLQSLEKNDVKDYNYSLNTEREVGTWYDGSKMYELSLQITIPSTNTSGSVEKSTKYLSDYRIKECIVARGFFTNSSGFCLDLPTWDSMKGDLGVRAYYSPNDRGLVISNGHPSYSGCGGYVTLLYNKK